MPCYYLHFVTLDFPAQADRGLVDYNPGPPLTRHVMNILFVEVEFLGDLLIREVQPHQVQTQDPPP